MNAWTLAEEMYERRRRIQGLRMPWTGLHAYYRQGYLIMAEAAMDAMTKALIRHSVAKGVGGLSRRKDLQEIASSPRSSGQLTPEK